MPDIAHQGDGGTGIFADLRGIHVDVHQDLVLHDEIGLADGAVRDTGADHDDHVRIIHGTVAVGLSVIAHHTVKERVLRGNGGKTHHGADCGDLILFQKTDDLIRGIAQVYAAAHADNGAFGALELSDHLFDLHSMTGHCGLIGPQVHALRIGEMAHGLLLDIDRQVDQDRASAAGIGDIEGLLDDPRNVRGIAHDIAVFDKRFAGAGNIRLLEYITAHHLAVHLTGDTYKGNTVRKRGRDSSDQICRSGAAGDDRHADFA